MYDLIQGISMVLYVIILTFCGPKYGFSKLKSFVMGLTAVSIGYFLIILVTWVENGFRSFGAQNAIRSFVFVPFLILIVSKWFKADFRKFGDWLAMPGMVWYSVGHLACLTTGCCHGFSYYEGTTMYKIAYALTGTSMLPQQIIESLGTLLIAVILLIIAIKYRYNTRGYMYYIMLILYGSQRFILEFFRDNHKIIVFRDMVSADGQIGISSLALWALAMVLEGIILLSVIVRYDKKDQISAEVTG